MDLALLDLNKRCQDFGGRKQENEKEGLQPQLSKLPELSKLPLCLPQDKVPG